ncbi:hypothetical protein GCM10018773_00620 [Streptomyces candidus]|nr:hypothetical protein GCM10018773_00620 [Streptomyces candidus]
MPPRSRESRSRDSSVRPADPADTPVTRLVFSVMFRVLRQVHQAPERIWYGRADGLGASPPPPGRGD